MIHILTVIFYQPLLNLLIFLYNVIPGQDMGLAIIAITIIIKLALYPLSAQSLKAQKAMTELQPKINEIKKQYKDQKEEQAKQLMNLYKQEKINPLSSCLPLLIQLPFLFAIYQVFRDGLSNRSMELLYPFIAHPASINNIAFGFLDLNKPQIILALLAGAAQFWQAKMLVSKRPEIKTPESKDEDMAAIMNKQMTYMMPIVTVIIGIGLPSGLTLYWFIFTLGTVFQQLVAFRHKKKKEVEVITNK
ncbi:MAG: YidC/Oxa1 family membrane protein insertase [Patescibacteria group bacterium]|jgi:YidC/Oxa1 family membrane protein insertase